MTHHIEPGKLWQNSFAESFNTVHPHSSLGYKTPAQFAASWSVA